MTKRIRTKSYRIYSAHLLVTIPCLFPSHDPKWHDTQVYRAKRGGYFIAGKGGSRSRWAKLTPQGAIPGEGIEPLSKAEARAYAIQHGMSPDRFARLGFDRPAEC